MQQQFLDIWKKLRIEKKNILPYLESITINNLKGIGTIQAPMTFDFNFPVTVIAGTNGSGKTTVLDATAAAYASTTTSPLAPKKLFPEFSRLADGFDDHVGHGRLLFSHMTTTGPELSEWARPKVNWVKGGNFPIRTVIRRSLANFAMQSGKNPNQILKSMKTMAPLAAPEVAFLANFMGRTYKKISQLKNLDGRYISSILSQNTTGEDYSYSDFHMAAGERAIIGLIRELGQHEGALVLIDEVEAGFHPYLQRLLMLELQRLSLRRKLQIVVTTHSSVVIDSVPDDARIFLHRDFSGEITRPVWRDVVERVLYGQALNRLAIICEDEGAKSFIEGVLDNILPQKNIDIGQIDIGFGGSKSVISSHIRTMTAVNMLDNCVFVLDGDGISEKEKIKKTIEEIKKMRGIEIKPRVIFLPGSDGPEGWVLDLLVNESNTYAPFLGLTPDGLTRKIAENNQFFKYNVSKEKSRSENIKIKLDTFAQSLQRDPNSQILRIISSRAYEQNNQFVRKFSSDLSDSIDKWRSAQLSVNSF